MLYKSHCPIELADQKDVAKGCASRGFNHATFDQVILAINLLLEIEALDIEQPFAWKFYRTLRPAEFGLHKKWIDMTRQDFY